MDMTLIPAPEPVAKYIWAIPHRFKSKVCMCDDPIWWNDAPFSYINYCGRCHKPMRFLLEKCVECGEVYIRDFIHDGRCVRPQCQKCWDCFSKTGKTCECPPHRGKKWEPIVVGPAGLNPKKFSAEELDNVFDF